MAVVRRWLEEKIIRRREILKSALSAPVQLFASWPGAHAESAATALAPRVRPGEPGWPDASQWDALKTRLNGCLVVPQSPFMQGGAAAAEALKYQQNPYYLGDQVGLAQSSGWFGAWTLQSSRFAVLARDANDVVAAVDFARQHRVRLVVKGGGHSYQGTSNAPDSLLVWTRRMRQIEHYTAFVGRGCEGHVEPVPAVMLGAGCVWMDAYHAVTTLGGRYVQGGGCPTVGVAGLIQSGGFGHFSKTFGTASSNLLQAEVVTADGQIRIANACMNPDLFWGLKGGGGGSLGVVTRVVLRTFDLPKYFGGLGGDIRASSDSAYRALIARFLEFYRDELFNAHWGEHVEFNRNVMGFTMMFQDLNTDSVERIWAPFLDWVRARKEYSFDSPIRTLTLPAQRLWDAPYFREHFPGHMRVDDRPGAPDWHGYWDGEQNEAGRFMYGYRSLWLPEDLLQAAKIGSLADALFEATRSRSVELYFGKGMAGGLADAVSRTRDTAMNPQVINAFALAIIGAQGQPAYPGMPMKGSNSDEDAHRAVRGLDQAAAALYRVAPGAGSYLSESDYFLPDWQERFWGPNYDRLACVKLRYDPEGLFVVHHGVGSEAWSSDGFVPVANVSAPSTPS